MQALMLLVAVLAAFSTWAPQLVAAQCACNGLNGITRETTTGCPSESLFKMRGECGVACDLQYSIAPPSTQSYCCRWGFFSCRETCYCNVRRWCQARGCVVYRSGDCSICDVCDSSHEAMRDSMLGLCTPKRTSCFTAC